MTSSDSLKIFFPLLEKVSCKLKMTGSKKKKEKKKTLYMYSNANSPLWSQHECTLVWIGVAACCMFTVGTNLMSRTQSETTGRGKENIYNEALQIFRPNLYTVAWWQSDKNKCKPLINLLTALISKPSSLLNTRLSQLHLKWTCDANQADLNPFGAQKTSAKQC